MSLHTSFHIGGPADALVVPADREDVRKVLRIAREEKTPLTVVGNGSNLLVRDKGIRGIVLKLGNALKHWEQNDGRFVFAGKHCFHKRFICGAVSFILSVVHSKLDKYNVGRE